MSYCRFWSFVALAVASIHVGLIPNSSAAAEPDDPGEQLKESALRLANVKKTQEDNPLLENRVREITWRLLVGELAADKVNGLNSSAYDAITRGILELDKLLTDLEDSPDLERQLTKQPQLAMRLDVTQVRRAELIAAKDLSRAEELSRLAQLRQLNRAYRALLQHLMAGQTEALAGQIDKVVSNGQEATNQLALVNEIVDKRRDFYLFEDEPIIDGASDELKLVKSLSVPYASDVKRHHQALLGLTLWRLAIQSEPFDEKLLEAAMAQADASLKNATEPNAVALYVRGLCCLKQGRLLTAQTPFQRQAHANAKDWFEKSQDALMQSRKVISADTSLAAMTSDIDRLVREGAEPSFFQEQARLAEQRGDLLGASQTLHRGASRHRQPELSMAWIEALWRFRERDFDYIEKLFTEALADEIVTTADLDFRLARGRIAVTHVWRVISELPEGSSVEDRSTRLLGILKRGLADLKEIPPDAAASTKWTAAALIAFADSTVILLDPQHDLAAANASLTRVPVVVNELQTLATAAKPSDRARFLESIQYARLAEGYLSLRLLPEYQDRARTAFAAAADAGAKLSGTAAELRPVGGAMLRAMLSRDAASGERLAHEERQLRSALQRMLPALASLSMAEPQQVSLALSSALKDMKLTAPAWDPRKQLDPRDVIGARESVLADARAVTVLTLIKSKQSGAAIQEFLTLWFPEVTVETIRTVNWVIVRDKTQGFSDPLTLFAFGSALEEFAIANLDSTDSLRSELLRDARQNYQRAIALLAETSVWNERWPQLASIVAGARDRLASDAFAVDRAVVLRNELRITEARAVLADALERHPKSLAVREQLISTLIDEAQINPAQEQALLAEALRQLEDARENDVDLPTSVLMTLGELRERSGNLDAASKVYAEVNNRSTNRGEQLKARSRLAIITARSAS